MTLSDDIIACRFLSGEATQVNWATTVLVIIVGISFAG
jgi:hypothetical protein